MYASTSNPTTSAERQAERQAERLPSRALVVPSLLTIDHRLEFRRLALAVMELAASNGQQAVEINLGTVVEIDASGLGVLILVQQRARERGMRLRRLHVLRTVGSLLDATRRGPLFEVGRAH